MNKLNLDECVPEEGEEGIRKMAMMTARQAPPHRAYPIPIGSGFFLEVKSGWEIKVLEDDLTILKAMSLEELESAFDDPLVRTILVPKKSCINRRIAMRVCQRNGQGKTVFFEG